MYNNHRRHRHKNTCTSHNVTNHAESVQRTAMMYVQCAWV